MKIIAVDNQDRETVSDKLICENIDSHWGEAIVKMLNDKFCPNDLCSKFFKLVPDDHKLYEFKY